MHIRKFGVALAALGLALFGYISPAQALTVTYTDIPDATIVHISATAAPGFTSVNQDVYAGQMVFTLSEINSPLYLYCVDVFHSIGLGSQNPPLIYNSQAFTTDFGGHALSQSTTQEIAWLANYGVASQSAQTRQAVQLAIWGKENVTWSTSNSSLTAEAFALQQSTAKVAYIPTVLVSNSGQAMIPTGAVPEPAAWMMFILGFGMIGGAIRYSNRQRLIFA